LVIPLVAILLPDDSADFSSSYPKHGRGGGAGMGMTDDWPLIMIDCQVGFDDPIWGQRNNPQFEHNAQALLAHWRLRNRKVIHVRHASLEPKSPLRAESPGFAFFDWATPREGEIEIVKHVNSGFIGTHLEETLRAGGQNGFVLLGLTTNHCVSTTVRMGGNLGFDVRLVGDACATFPRTAMDGEMFDADVVHRTALASLHGEFCTVIDSKDVLLEAS
jgi:nicotinamidase-related amidase